MSEERSGLSDAVQQGAGAANAIRGAIKTGKALSGAAKGAAAGGPYGAALMFAFENRKTIGKMIAAASLILLLPVLFILMLPSLIFGGLSGGFTESNLPVINDSATISKNVVEIVSVIGGVLNDGQNDVYSRIEADFTASGCDQLEIINPYADKLVYNGSLFVAQYCASKDEDFAGVSLSDMESILRGHIDELYTHTSTTEVRTATVETVSTDPETGKEVVTTTEVEETWKIYTIVYNGEYYFADKVFGLSEEQTQLSTDYANNLSLFLSSPEYAELFALLNCMDTDIALTSEEIAAIRAQLPADLSELRGNVVLTAYSLVGKVSYFWGGKSVEIGWDNRWGSYRTVTSAGSKTTGTVRPFGMDCSGFVTWAFVNACNTADAVSAIGHGTKGQISRCTKINWNDAQPGDLIFLNDLSHVGIVAANDNGILTVVHCSSSANNVSAGAFKQGNSYGFGIVARPNLYDVYKGGINEQAK